MTFLGHTLYFAEEYIPFFCFTALHVKNYVKETASGNFHAGLFIFQTQPHNFAISTQTP